MLFFHRVIRKILNSRHLNASSIIMLGFLLVIFIGATLLTLPIASKQRVSTDFLSCLFTATSATCVTGLVIFDTFTHWSLFGQVVILFMIQTGGLGFITILMLFFMISRVHLGMKSKIMVMTNFGLESLEGIWRFFKHVLVITFGIEAIGALLLSIVYIPKLGIYGIWTSIFHSVSAFCNAGFDINGFIKPGISMRCCYGNGLVLIVLAFLIIIGGIGFFVWEDLLSKKSLVKTSLYTKLVLIMTGILIFSGTLLFCITEWNNPYTIGRFTTGEKILNSFFQSVTLRTAGFESFSQSSMTDVGKMLSVIYMFIGGSAGSTAGGIKTATAFVAIIAMLSAFQGNRDTYIFKRRIGHKRVISAFAVIMLAVILDLSGGLIISFTEGIGFVDSLFETVSAYATVGLTVGVTDVLSPLSKVLYIFYMFMGRVGVTTIGIVILTTIGSRGQIKYPKEDIIIG